jgi:hypothetical protein
VTGAYGWQPYYLHVPVLLKSGSLSLLEQYGPVQACNGMLYLRLFVYFYLYLAACCHLLLPGVLRLLTFCARTSIYLGNRILLRDKFCASPWRYNSKLSMFFSGFSAFALLRLLYCFLLPYCFCFVFAYLFCFCFVFVSLCWLDNRHLWCLACTLIDTTWNELNSIVCVCAGFVICH